jgi:hypothetical protein
MNVPTPTPIFRFLHVDNLETCLRRGGLHAPNHTPNDGLPYKTIHNVDIQKQRRVKPIPCGPRGVIHDYVSFYFGPRSPMLFQLHTGRVAGYTEGQEPLIYAASTAQAVQRSGARFVFSDGHGIATFTQWFDNLAELNKVDWDAAYATIWRDTVDDMDRQRRKQAEFLIHRRCDWSLIHEIGVVNERMKTQVERILDGFPAALHRPVNVRPDWYY